MNKHTKTILRSTKFNQGATLIEVMISVLLLTFGIMALMAAQLRSVASVQEAENRTLIAQAAEALAEGMQANPTLSLNSAKKLVISYEKYTKDHATLQAPKKSGSVRHLGAMTGDLHQRQLDNFEVILNDIPDIASIKYSICQDKDNPAEPTMSNANCSGADTTVIKVVWQMKNHNSSNSKDVTDFTYMLKVKG